MQATTDTDPPPRPPADGAKDSDPAGAPQARRPVVLCDLFSGTVTTEPEDDPV